MLAPLADNDDMLRDLFDLDNATNERLRGEYGGLPGIGVDELVFGVPNFRIINAAYTYPRPEGSRFNDGERGAWYCAFEPETALAEITFHKTVEYQEIDRFDDSVTYQTLLADFTSTFHDLRARARLRQGAGAGQLHRLAAAGRAAARRRLDGGDFPQRAARRRHQPGVLPPRPGGQCAQRRRLSVNMGGFADSGRRVHLTKFYPYL